MLQLNLHGLLFSQNSQKPCFINNISLSTQCKNELLDARKEVRSYLKDNLANRLQRKAPGRDFSSVKSASPKFFTQGSWAYKTINAPCHTPPQQSDLDDGAYLPFSYIETQPPHDMSVMLFESVEELLEELASKKGWEVCNKNNNCTRVVISEDKHLDIPVYSIPDDDFTSISAGLESAKKRVVASMGMNLNESFESMYQRDHSAAMEYLRRYDEQVWEDMPEGVLMATKDNGWISSDPRPFRDWVTEQVETKGEQLRRVMRYIKAWRDHQHWVIDDPKSILLMVAVDMAFDAEIRNRDDLALLAALERLPSILAGQVFNPTTVGKPDVEPQDLSSRLDEKGIRCDVINRLRQFHSDLSKAINSSPSPEGSCQTLIQHLGNRVPYEPTMVAHDTVRTSEPKVQKAVPPIGRVDSA